MLRNAGIDVAIMTTVSKWNVHDIPKLVDEVVKIKQIFLLSQDTARQKRQGCVLFTGRIQEYDGTVLGEIPEIRSRGLRDNL